MIIFAPSFYSPVSHKMFYTCGDPLEIFRAASDAEKIRAHIMAFEHDLNPDMAPEEAEDGVDFSL